VRFQVGKGKILLSIKFQKGGREMSRKGGGGENTFRNGRDKDRKGDHITGGKRVWKSGVILVKMKAVPHLRKGGRIQLSKEVAGEKKKGQPL